MTGDNLATRQPPRTQATRRTVWPMACIVFAASFAWFLIGTNDMALIDRDEPMIAEVARQMVHRNEWLTPHLPAWEEKSIFKPPLAMWVMAASFEAFGVSELTARLPSVLCSALTVTVLFVVASRRWGYSAGFVAAACMALPLLPAMAGRMALTDPLLTLLATTALLCLEKSLRTGPLDPVATPALSAGVCTTGEGTGDPASAEGHPDEGHGWLGLLRNALMWIVLGLAMLIKGPAILAFFGPAVVMAADRFRWKPYLLFAAGMLLATWGGSLLLNDGLVPGMILGGLGGAIVAGSLLRWLLPSLRLPIGVLWGLPLMLVTAGWWFAYISQSGGVVHQASAKRFILFEVLTRIAQPMEHHSGPLGYYLAIALVGLLPFSALLPGLLLWSFRNRKINPTLQLLLAWMVGSWMLCEISSTKLPHYILPAWPALALLSAMWWKQTAEIHQPTDRKRAFGLVVPCTIFAAILGIVALLAWRVDARIWLGEWFGDQRSEIWPRIAYLGRMEPWQVGSLLLAPILLAITAAIAWLLASRRSVRLSLLALTLGWAPALLVLVATIAARTPFSDSLSRQAARQALLLGQSNSRYLAVGYTEPALFFYLPADRYERVENPRQIPSLARMDEPFILIASRKLEPAVREWLGDRIADMQIVDGINTPRGQPEAACVFAIAAAQTKTPPAATQPMGAR